MKKHFYNLCMLMCFVIVGQQAAAQSLEYRTPKLKHREAGLFSFNRIQRLSDGEILALKGSDMSNSALMSYASESRLLVNESFGIGNPDLSPSSMYASEDMTDEEYQRRNRNRRLIYSCLWAYASLNYIYADAIQFMDKDEHLKYHTGTVNGFKMSPGFIAGSAAFMQVALTNVFLPHVIKNDKTLRWVQIASGTVMTLVQSATLFSGKPTPYYAVFSGVEIAATGYITIDALRWKVKKNPGKY